MSTTHDTRRQRGVQKMDIINLTPHDIHLVLDGSSTPGLVIPRASETGARARAVSHRAGTVEHAGHVIPEYITEYGAPHGLPDPRPDTILIVSVITAQAAAAAGRPTHDLRLTHDLVRDADGRIVGCRGLCRVRRSGGPEGA